MTAERYAQVRKLFLAACELAENEVAEFVDGACAGDPQLREELQSLLKQPRTTTIIGTSSEDVARGKVLSPIADLPRGLIPAGIPGEAERTENPRRFSAGETVAAGRYKILGPLGAGGAGEVYKAHDQILDQDVALKFVADHERGAGADRWQPGGQPSRERSRNGPQSCPSERGQGLRHRSTWRRRGIPIDGVHRWRRPCVIASPSRQTLA